MIVDSMQGPIHIEGPGEVDRLRGRGQGNIEGSAPGAGDTGFALFRPSLIPALSLNFKLLGPVRTVKVKSRIAKVFCFEADMGTFSRALQAQSRSFAIECSSHSPSS